ncbi:DNA-directed RNA polymerase V subunit 1 isoform X2 [Diospyros lotus]|uniref:DNA-directed RNA polymerase V subunit 1 isoform X2 n=1 Tax=Diospyros lotus TaxID=55363 RepID=UPI00225A5552|nr:DNA-directed RNA polymerase V subunit 1 isoform X2 [Diospyros lotus]
MEESPSTTVWDGRITGIKFGLASSEEICISSNSDFPITHASQLANPFLGLPLDSGKCESCGAVEPGNCEGHFGYIELPIPIYHPSHLSELKRLLSLLCLKCLKLKSGKVKDIGFLERALSSCCEEASQISVDEVTTTDGAGYIELKLPSKSNIREGYWNFLDRYGYRYGEGKRRPLLPSEVNAILKKIPAETKKKLAVKGYFPQDGYIIQYLPVPPNCLSVPDISDGITVMSSDLSITMLKKVLKQVEIIKSSRSGTPNFESHEVEANDLQATVAQYLRVRGAAKASRDVETRFGIRKELNDSSTKAWLEKMKTLFIRKGSGFSSRSVITGDAYKGVQEIGLPFEIAQRITFEERVTQYNMQYLQKLVDEKLCLTYRDGSSTYSLREGSKGHTFLRPGQVVHRRVMDGDIVFINRPPTTHKHSLQALSVYVHDDHTVKINPLICGPLSADFDGDCVHLFYPQSLAAKAEVLELFSVDKQLQSSHSGNLNLQLTTDSLLSLKIMFKNYFFSRAVAQQLVMFVSNSLPLPAVVKAQRSGPQWTALQVLQTALPRCFDFWKETSLIRQSEILSIDFSRDLLQGMTNDIITSIFCDKDPGEVLKFFNFLQPLLMEHLFSNGYSVSLEDFSIPTEVVKDIKKCIQDVSPLLRHLRSAYNELVELQLENQLRLLRVPVANFVLKSSAIGNVIDSKSDSAINKVVQQIGFLGLQLSDKGKFYSKSLVGDMAYLFEKKYPLCGTHPSEEFGLVTSCLFHGLDPYQEMVHSISAREVIVRSSRGLTEPGTLFKNLMAILRDVVICYDGTVRNLCSNSIIQFEYGYKPGTKRLFVAGEPVGVLAATAMSNPAYKAVLDSSPSSNSSWEMMKEILLCSVNFKNDLSDRRVIIYLNDCDCGRKYCRENAAYLVKNQLKKVRLKDIAAEFLIEYNGLQRMHGSSEFDANLLGHVHLNKAQFEGLHMDLQEACEKCQETMNSFRKKKKVGHLFKRLKISACEDCSFGQSSDIGVPCLKFWQDIGGDHLERNSHILADTVCPVLLETVIKGDRRVCWANVIWISPDTTTWIRNPCKSKEGELALDVVLEKEAIKRSGDAWRILMDCCLPVIHLIDTSRSIPNAIKQVQELLGISCAFEQAVQRLSTSVSMVAKGVLKDHLILLANSMTCPGNMIGFNSGGIKALSRSLNVQVPFAEATLFTPKKCFERAAEKCHADSLSSIVASCSWGKHVTVGTGSQFDVLWGTREVGLNNQEGIDVYNFLHLVRSSREEETGTDCLGTEIDNIELENDDMEWAPSPDRSSDKPIFEDSSEVQNDLEDLTVDWSRPSGSNWEKVSCLNTESSGRNDDHGDGKDWMVDKKQNLGGKKSLSESSGWSSWGLGTVRTDDVLCTTTEKTKQGDTSKTVVGWGHSNSDRSDELESQSGKRKESPSYFWNSSGNDESNDGIDWMAGKKPHPGAGVTPTNPSGSSSWGADSVKTQDNLWNSSQNDKSNDGNDWLDGKKKILGSSTMSVNPSGWSSWGADTGKTHDNLWNSSQNDESNDEWLAGKKKNLGAGTAPANPSGWSSWGADAGKTQDNLSRRPPELQQDILVDESQCTVDEKSQAGQKKESPASLWNRSQNVMNEQTNQSASESGWDPANTVSQNESVQPQWGKPRRFSSKKEQTDSPRGWGSSNTGDWKNKAVGNLTATRQRLDMFTSEEQDILSDVELIMQSIRRILHQTGYNDGDPLSAEDQSFVLDNVFTHHPDKSTKMGAGIDYVMVTKHSSFQDSRCFYIVKTDGHKEDFSYRKCLENFIRGKYPDRAEAFIPKYFKKPRSGWNRERSVAPDEAGPDNRPARSGWNRESSIAPDEAVSENRRARSGWNRESSVAPDEAGPENRPARSGWNRESSVAPDDARPGNKPARSGWNREGSVTPDEAEPKNRW